MKQDHLYITDSTSVEISDVIFISNVLPPIELFTGYWENGKFLWPVARRLESNIEQSIHWNTLSTSHTNVSVDLFEDFNLICNQSKYAIQKKYPDIFQMCLLCLSRFLKRQHWSTLGNGSKASWIRDRVYWRIDSRATHRRWDKKWSLNLWICLWWQQMWLEGEQEEEWFRQFS